MMLYQIRRLYFVFCFYPIKPQFRYGKVEMGLKIMGVSGLIGLIPPVSGCCTVTARIQGQLLDYISSLSR